jgi:thiamine biosynthesis lipoprotein
MATNVTFTACGADTHLVEQAIDKAIDVFHQVEAQCTRFDPASPLMQANAASEEMVEVPPLCFAALKAAAKAYVRTAGRFDPRVHDDLRKLGYTKSMGFETGGVAVEGVDVDSRPELPRWEPTFDEPARRVRLGGHRVDLGGIGKGLAVRWASAVLRRTTDNFLIEAGGDCYAAGYAPDGGAWRIGVEDPTGAPEPLLVLGVSERAVTTSSIRVRRWTAGEAAMHHLIDPRTGLPGGDGMLAVTVVGADPADAEVDAKVLFLEGRDGIEAAAAPSAACWVAADRSLGSTAAFERYVLWRRP